MGPSGSNPVFPSGSASREHHASKEWAPVVTRWTDAHARVILPMSPLLLATPNAAPGAEMTAVATRNMMPPFVWSAVGAFGALPGVTTRCGCACGDRPGIDGHRGEARWRAVESSGERWEHRSRSRRLGRRS
ncbi:hypothetical protein BD311DRAFT_5901 [Dichomitus squalens]|uniref:Uncharacterized protein n=1 Tax=Dichomitus squalens TaxID=114155 RepID=A0A4Q9N832_9APHY|nr:hypothetical protein BD311DRAFT_5901 [Dichomitus squalens]